jgi:hypothetical protein
MKFLLILLYIYKGDVVIERIPQPSIEICQKDGQKRIVELMKDPRFEAGIIAQCIQHPTLNP